MVKKTIWRLVAPIAAMPGIALAQAGGVGTPPTPIAPATQAPAAQAEAPQASAAQAPAAQGPAAQGPVAQAKADPGYLLGPNDEIKISVYNQPDLSVTTRVKTDGTVILAFLGAVSVTGKTTAQLAADLSAAYAKGGYLINPSINVEVSQFVSRFVTVLGNVPQAGNYPLDRSYTLASMLARAGGATPNGANAVILTPADGSGAVRISLVGMGAGVNRVLMPGDILFVPPAEKVYVYGQVQQAGAFTYVPGQTFRQALALAGGPTLAGTTRRIKVRRGGKEMENVSLDDPIQPEDVLIIREKLF